jgi:DNA-binding winged helix-turn-helix (wHTH) protein
LTVCDCQKAWRKTANSATLCRPSCARICASDGYGIFGTVGEFLGDFLAKGKVFTFGAFSLDVDTRQLLRGSDREPVHLSPKAYDLLRVLVDERPRAVAKDELHERLWPSTFVSEATLASLVSEVREALGERGRERGVIRTVHGFGYAFSGVAEEIGRADPGCVASWIVCNGRETSLGQGEHLIGRDADVAVALSSPTVSRHHARIVIAGATATLEDLGSKNGTSVRGKKITSPLKLNDGDRIRIGAFELTFRTLTAMGSTETQR